MTKTKEKCYIRFEIGCETHEITTNIIKPSVKVEDYVNQRNINKEIKWEAMNGEITNYTMGAFSMVKKLSNIKQPKDFTLLYEEEKWVLEKCLVRCIGKNIILLPFSCQKIV